MSMIPVKCPSCGANITMNDEKEYGFCQFCGTQILNDAIQKYKIEYSGDPMCRATFNTTNNITKNVNTVYNVDKRKAKMIISKPNISTLVIGIISIVFSLLIVATAVNDNRMDLAGLFLIIVPLGIGVLCLFLYFRALKLYDMAIKNAIMNNDITIR